MHPPGKDSCLPADDCALGNAAPAHRFRHAAVLGSYFLGETGFFVRVNGAWYGIYHTDRFLIPPFYNGCFWAPSFLYNRSKKMEKLLLTVACVFLSVSASHAATRSSCPSKVLETGRIEGIYRGTECGDFCYADIELSNGEMFSLIADEDKIVELFGQGTGQRVSAEYRLEQFWIEEGQHCARDEVLASGKVLSATSAVSSADAQAPPAHDAVSPTGNTRLFAVAFC